MNWQLLKNVNPPREVVLELYFEEDRCVRFAERSEDGESIYIGSGYYDGQIDGNVYRTSYEKFKRFYGDKVYWSLFVKP